MYIFFTEPYNISYFFETLPPEFDNWDLNTKAAYFTEWLVGYAELPTLIKVIRNKLD